MGTGDYYGDLPSDYTHPAFDTGGTDGKSLTIKEEYLEDVQLFTMVNSYPIKDANEETRASIYKYLMDGYGILGTHGTIAGRSNWETGVCS